VVGGRVNEPPITRGLKSGTGQRPRSHYRRPADGRRTGRRGRGYRRRGVLTLVTTYSPGGGRSRGRQMKAQLAHHAPSNALNANQLVHCSERSSRPIGDDASGLGRTDSGKEAQQLDGCGVEIHDPLDVPRAGPRRPRPSQHHSHTQGDRQQRAPRSAAIPSRLPPKRGLHALHALLSAKRPPGCGDVGGARPRPPPRAPKAP
jgi:hypothetical protein